MRRCHGKEMERLPLPPVSQVDAKIDSDSTLLWWHCTGVPVSTERTFNEQNNMYVSSAM